MKNLRHILPALFVLVGGISPGFAQTAIDLGSSANFAVLAGSAITFTGATTITGDVGSYPTPAITGVTPTFLSGSNHGGDSFTQTAKADLASAYADAAGRSGTIIATELGGTTLTPGVYSAGTFAITGNLTLNGSGVYIFQAGSTLGTAIGGTVLLTNGAQADNVFWQVGSSATFLDNSVIVGNVLAFTSITAGTGNMVDGRLLAMGGAVTFGSGTITAPAAIPEPSTTAVLVAGLMGLVVAVRRFGRRVG